jgi:NAD(P)-dependent dehydrogenase (short-subunit alcohol dehydrogenase family)
VTSWALVTGASSGIGRALAGELVDHGYSVVVAAEDDRIEEVAQELDRDGVRVVPAQVDLSSASDVELLCARVAELTPRLDVAALNAGSRTAAGSSSPTWTQTSASST